MLGFLKRNGVFVCLSVIVLFISACATYYEKNLALMQSVYEGKLDVAEKLLDDPSLEKKKKDILLYYFNRGTVLWLNGKSVESNKFFQQADYYIEDYHKNYAATAISFLSNPKVEPYGGESFEQILLHYYTTINYAQLGDLDGALVETKRMLSKMQRVTDSFKGKNKYKRDAFAQVLTGLIYDAQGNYNDAFIAYRNGYEIYKEDYVKQLLTPVPEQLKKDLIRTAHLTGFYEEQRQYEAEFGIKYQPEDKDNGTLLFFWNNGFGPVKDQWSINFSVVPMGNGWVNFVNLDLGLTFPFYAGEQGNSLSSLSIIRVAFPKYISRDPYFKSAYLVSDSLKLNHGLEMAEDVNAIAYKSLDDRMVKEMGEALLRLAIKQVAEQALRKQNEALGMALSIVNAVSEQADTRNWQLLPYSINYGRISLPAGKHNIKLVAKGNTSSVTDETPFTFNIKKGQTTFGCFQSLQFEGYSRR